MLYTAYKDNIVYSAQRQINFPRNGPSGKIGHENMIFLMCPNRDKGITVMEDTCMMFQQSMVKRVVTDAIYKERIGTKRIVSLERMQTDKKYMALENFPLQYIPYGSRKTFLNKKFSVINDISRWMELFFMNSDNLGVKRKCEEFMKILSGRLKDSDTNGYEKLLVFDLNSWTSSIKSCVVMNRKLLNNPFSIILYTACFYPDLMRQLPNVRLMVVNRSAGQVYFVHTDYISKRTYPSIKSKLNVFKSMVFSMEDETETTITPNNPEAEEDEVRAQILSDFKKDLKSKLRYNLLGDQSGNKRIYDIIEDEEVEDVTTSIIEDDIAPADNAKEVEDDDAEISASNIELDSNIDKLIEEELEVLDDVSSVDPDEVSYKIASKIKAVGYKSSFMPIRSDEEKERIKRLTQDQIAVIGDETEDVDKSIKETITGGYIKTTNPNIQTSRFANFDNEYTDKCLARNIDNAVGILARAEDKIFVTSKTIEDSSTPMDLKETYTYKLEDEKGNKSTLKFDIPKVIDGTYVYLNGSKKNIRHQFILKPIVKTSPDTVQIVTAYNKIFIRRKGFINQNINKIRVFISKNEDRFKTKSGNCSMRNSKYEVPLDWITMSKYYTEFKIGNVLFMFAVDAVVDKYKSMTGKVLEFNKAIELPIGINTSTKEPVMLKLTDSFTTLLLNTFSEEDVLTIGKIKRNPKYIMAKAKIMGSDIPLVLFMMYCEGFKSVMEKANIEYHFVTDKKDLKKYNTFEYDIIGLSDGFIVWKKDKFRNELLMNGFSLHDMTDFSFEELESKDTFISILGAYFVGKAKYYVALDNYRDFLLDDKAKEILKDFDYPTDLIQLLVVAAGMLTDNHFLIENHTDNMRVRSTEVIADLVYIAVTKAYTEYRKTAYKKNPTKVSIKPSTIIDALLDSDTNMIEEYSTLNPVLELEKQRSVTFKGIRGIQKDRAMTLPRRSYDNSMLGTVGITTSPDANVGVVRQLTLEPQITSVYGYIDSSKSKNPEELTSSELFTTAELLQPFGVTHDDPDRTSMSYKQTKYMIPITDSDPVLIGNKVEAVVPYLLTDEFVVTAKENGSVIEVSEGFCVVQYKSGEKYAIDISPRVRKNSSAGFWIDNTLTTDLKLGDKFKKGDILAMNKQHFTRNKEDRGASMNLGALCKIAISSQWDIFEDSAPISRRLSDKLATEMVEEKDIFLSPFTYIDYMVKVGDTIKAGDPLLKFSDAIDEDMSKLLDVMRKENKESLIEDAKTTVTSKFTGEIVDIKIYTTVETSELDPSLKAIVDKYHGRIKKKNAVLKKHSNPGDLEYYRAGQVISETEDVIIPNKSGKVKGYEMSEDGVLILFYIKYKVAASKGDKVVVSVCKGIVSHVFEEGMEPYSEYRPEEPIDTIVAPLAVAARKVPAIFLTIFGNKLLIELKKQCEELYLGD